MYFRNFIPKDIKEIKDEEIDLKIRITNDKPEIVIKKGIFGSLNTRKEVSIFFEKEEIQKYIDFLSILGWSLGVIYTTNSHIYEYENIEFSLVKIGGYGYNFEVEILCDKKDVNKAKEKIEKMLKKLNLNKMSEEDLNKQCNIINNRKELQFNFNSESYKDVMKRVKDII